MSLVNAFSKLVPSLIIGFLFLVLAKPIKAQTDTGWVITDFNADVQVNQDTTVNVTETIKVDFDSLQKHGIYRIIPVKYKDRFGNNLDIRFKLLKITDENGQPLNLAAKSLEKNNLRLQIGDPNKTVSGKQTYVIVYQVNRVITTPDQTAELYWNITGNEWPVPILKASATVSAPRDSLKNTICYADFSGESGRNCQTSHDSNRSQFASGLLTAGMGLTAAIALDPAKLTFPSFWQKLDWFLQDNWIYATPLLVLAIMWRLWWVRGRDKQYKNIFNETGGIETVPLFEKLDSLMAFGPIKDLLPGEADVLVDETVHLRDITATVIDLARRGFLTIKELPKKGWFGKIDFELTNKKQAETNLAEYEKEVLNLLFGQPRKTKVKLSQPPKSAYQHLDQAQKKLYAHLTEQGYFLGNPNKVRQIYLGIGIGIIAVGTIAAFSLQGSLNLVGALFATIVSGVTVMIFAFFMPARSAKGRKALKEIVGLREWIRLGAWREQIHERHNFFEEVLPYTIAFGLTYKFINAFTAADIKNLSWYQSSSPLTLTNFSNSMDSFGHSLNSGVAATKPRSAASGGSGFSGGFSGGGFGGGGGGSW